MQSLQSVLRIYIQVKNHENYLLHRVSFYNIFILNPQNSIDDKLDMTDITAIAHAGMLCLMLRNRQRTK